MENDFHNRKDLTPDICAVYTKKELRTKGISPVYRITDHIGFYERYGWEFYCMVQSDGERHLSRLYVHR